MASNNEATNSETPVEESVIKSRRSPKEHDDIPVQSSPEAPSGLFVDLPQDLKDDHSDQDSNAAEDIQPIPTITPKPKVVLRRTSSTSQETPVIPKVNCTEKIILCIDHSSPMHSTSFRRTIQSIKSSSTMQVLSGAIRQFVMTKTMIDKQHEFALLVVNNDAQFISDFGTHGSEVLFMLQEITNNKAVHSDDVVLDDCFDLSLLFDQVEKHVTLPKYKQGPATAPPYVVRVIFVYGRSNCKLEFLGNKESYENLRKSPYFFFDSIFIHDEPTEDNCVTDVFTRLCELDVNGTSHILEVGLDGSMSALYNALAKLLSHPLQRQRQTDNISYDIISLAE